MRITEIYAWVDESDGLVAANVGSLFTPLVYTNLSSMAMRDVIRETAKTVAKIGGKRLTLVKFTDVTVVDHIGRSDT